MRLFALAETFVAVVLLAAAIVSLDRWDQLQAAIGQVFR